MLQGYNWKIALLDFFILVSWAFLLFDAHQQANEIPAMLANFTLPQIPLWLIMGGGISIPIGIAVGTFWQRKRIMEELPLLTKLLDRWLFKDAYKFFMNRLHAVYASIASSCLFGILGIHITHTTTQSLLGYGLFFGSVMFSICMLFAVAASRRYPPILR